MKKMIPWALLFIERQSYNNAGQNCIVMCYIKEHKKGNIYIILVIGVCENKPQANTRSKMLSAKNAS